MLIEIKDAEAYIEPRDILTQAIQEGDLSIDIVIYECIAEESADAVLDAIDNEDIRYYAQVHNITQDINTYEQILKVALTLSQTDKARLLWQLLKCEEV